MEGGPLIGVHISTSFAARTAVITAAPQGKDWSCGSQTQMPANHGGYTAKRRPVTLVFSQWFERISDAIAAERQVKGWSRAKKEALIRGDFEALRMLSKRSTRRQVG
jgi:putative endonuclease